MTVTVECQDPRVLAEHRSKGGPGTTQILLSGGWSDATVETEESFRDAIVNAECRYRLVFSDAEAAGKGLADYAERLDAAVEIDGGTDGWRPSRLAVEGYDTGIASNLAEGTAYRIAAPPAASEEPPSPQPDRDFVYPVGPVGREFACWLADKPDGWQWRTRPGEGWHTDDWSGCAGSDCWVLARPVPPAEPETERIPWWESVTRTTADGRTVCEAKRTLGGIVLWKRSGPADPYQEFEPAADGTVEVLVLGDQGDPR